MAAITAKAVAELRAKTNCGMMECKKALTEAEGNFDEAIKILREKGLATAATPEFAEMSKNVALQVAAMNCEFVNRDAVPAARLAEEKEIIATQIKNDPKNASKPDAIIEKMAVGKLGKFFEQVCLADQAYVKDDSMSVAKYVESVAKELGAKITLVDFCRYEKGEGLQKREDNFADEIASLVK